MFPRERALLLRDACAVPERFVHDRLRRRRLGLLRFVRRGQESGEHDVEVADGDEPVGVVWRVRRGEQVRPEVQCGIHHPIKRQKQRLV